MQKMKLSSLMLLIILALNINSLQANNHQHDVIGNIQNETGEPVIGATVRIVNTVTGAVTDKSGNFILKNIPHGKYTLLITSIGYERAEQEIELNHGDSHIYEMQVTMKNALVNFDKVVVTATRSAKIYEDVPVKVSVVEGKLFEATSSATLHEGLSFQPGLRVENNCSNCGFSQVRLNGLEGQYTQILINSKPVYSALGGVYGLEQIPANMIDRVEVVRGGGSALYGSSAVGGVVNVITKDPDANSFSLGSTQSFTNGEKPDNYTFLNGAIVSEAQNTGLSFFGNFRDRTHWDANDDGISEMSQLAVNSFGGHVFFKPGIYNRFGLNFHYIKDDRRGGNKFGLPAHETDVTEMTNHSILAGDFSFEQYLGSKQRSNLSLYASMRHINRDSYYGVEQDPNAYGHTENTTLVSGLQFSHIITESFIGEQIITAGYEFKYDDMVDVATGYGRNLMQTTEEHGFYLQDDFSLNDRFSVVIGARLDKHNLLDEFMLSPRANALFKVTDALSLRGNFSTGYRAPQAFNEDLHITQVGGEGLLIRISDNLKEERSLSLGFSADYNFRVVGLPLAISAEYFHTTLDDVFVLNEAGRDGSGNIILERRNGDGAIVQGLTVELQTAISNSLDLKSGVTYEKSEYVSPVQWSENPEVAPLKSLARSPEWYGYFSIGYFALPRFELNVSSIITGSMLVPHYLSEVKDDASDELYESEMFFEVNFKASYLLLTNPNIEINAGMINVLNSFQSNFDYGTSRDAGFIYGPSRPQTFFVGIKTSI